MSAREWLDAAQERADAAHDEVVRLCEGGRFTMTVPVEDTDSDVVLGAPAEDLPLAIAALRAALAVHAEHIAPLARAGRENGQCQCVACDMARAITAALDGAS